MITRLLSQSISIEGENIKKIISQNPRMTIKKEDYNSGAWQVQGSIEEMIN